MDTLFSHLPLFFCGCVGALAPEIVRLYKLKTRKNKYWRPTYFIISLFFALLGGFMAWILQASTYYAAFYIGVSFPTVISAISKQGMKVSAPTAKRTKYVIEDEEESETTYADNGSEQEPINEVAHLSFTEAAHEFLTAL
jgi:hypothetical protein